MNLLCNCLRSFLICPGTFLFPVSYFLSYHPCWNLITGDFNNVMYETLCCSTQWMSFVPMLTAVQSKTRPDNVTSQVNIAPAFRSSHIDDVLLLRSVCVKLYLLYLKPSELYSPLCFFNKALKGKTRSNWATVFVCVALLVPNVNKSSFDVHLLTTMCYSWQSKIDKKI